MLCLTSRFHACSLHIPVPANKLEKHLPPCRLLPPQARSVTCCSTGCCPCSAWGCRLWWVRSTPAWRQSALPEAGHTWMSALSLTVRSRRFAPTSARFATWGPPRWVLGAAGTRRCLPGGLGLQRLAVQPAAAGQRLHVKNGAAVHPVLLANALPVCCRSSTAAGPAGADDA